VHCFVCGPGLAVVIEDHLSVDPREKCTDRYEGEEGGKKDGKEKLSGETEGSKKGKKDKKGKTEAKECGE
jgi:hypothetical protein